MADETTNGGQNAQSSAGTQNAGTHENGVPQSRFNEVIHERNELRQQLEAMQRQIEDVKAAQLKEQNDYKSLYEQTLQTLNDIRPRAQLVDDYTTALRETANAQIQQLPSDMRDLVPEFGDPRLTLDWLNKNASKLMRPPAPNYDAGVRGDSGGAGAQLPNSLTEMAKRFGLKPDQIVDSVVRNGGERPPGPFNPGDKR